MYNMITYTVTFILKETVYNIHGMRCKNMSHTSIVYIYYQSYTPVPHLYLFL